MFKHLFAGSADQITSRLDKAQALQLILIASDEYIIDSIESLIDSQRIKIPVTEVRTPIVSPRMHSWFRVGGECSRFGIRFIPKSRNMALARLKRLVYQIYMNDNNLAILEWELRHVSGATLHEKLDAYLFSAEPPAIIRDFELNDVEHLQQAFNVLRFGRFNLPTSPGVEEQLIEKLLWKLGFDPIVYPPYQNHYWQRLDNLLAVSRTYGPYNESDKEAIRSAGVNFFVSLEEVLDYSLSFSTWALLADHFGKTRFVCNFDAARHFMASRLNGMQYGSNDPLHFDESGKNTLYPLIQGFAVLANLLEAVVSNGNGTLRRAEEEMPEYHHENTLEVFPFVHKVMALDTPVADLNRIIVLLKSVTEILEANEVSSIRNRIEHRRIDFPTQQEIEKACTALSSVMTQMEAAGVAPLVSIYKQTVLDEYSRGFRSYRDYKGRETRISEPSQFHAARLPSVELRRNSGRG